MHPIRLYRLAKGLSQAELAQAVGVKLNAAHRWEKGAMPRGKHLTRLAEVLGVEPVRLIQEIEAYRKEGARAAERGVDS